MGPDTGSEPLPPLFARWIAELLGGPIPRETRATCDNCAMWPSAGEESGPESCFFDPVIKCCTYLPNLYNFLAGGILSDGEAGAQAGRVTVEQRIAQGVGVTPLGLAQSPVFSLLYNNSENFFGRSRALHCPHYLQQEGRCGIWRHRESTCATWFCKHVRGELGRNFWINSLHQLLLALQADLARWCVLELHPSDDMLRQLVASAEWTFTPGRVTGEALDNRVEHETYARLWGEWRGREADYFCRCARLVESLSWAEVLALGGPTARAYAQLTRQAYRRLISDELPSALNVGSIQVAHVQHGMVRINTYSNFDPLDVPAIIIELLLHFDGRPTVDALAAIAQQKGVRVESDLLRKMVDFGLLVPKRPRQSS